MHCFIGRGILFKHVQNQALSRKREFSPVMTLLLDGLGREVSQKTVSLEGLGVVVMRWEGQGREQHWRTRHLKYTIPFVANKHIG